MLVYADSTIVVMLLLVLLMRLLLLLLRFLYCCCIRVQSEVPGLVWGEAHKLVPVAFGVKKLVLSCVVEDDKVIFS